MNSKNNAKCNARNNAKNSARSKARDSKSNNSAKNNNKCHARANELNDQYLSDADKTYELNKLRRQIEGSIDDTDIIPHKQALNKLQDELNKK